MSLITHNQFVSRFSDGFSRNEPIKYRQGAAASASFGNGLLHLKVMAEITKAVPTLETGVTAYVPTMMAILGSTAGTNRTDLFLVGLLTDLGSLDLSTNVFTDGSSMGTRLEGNSTIDVASPVFFEVTTVLNATPGTFTVTYTDQDGNSQTTAAVTPTASAAVGTGGYLPLNTGDWGVRDITASVRSGGTSPSGVIKFWGIIPLDMAMATLDMAVSNLFTDGLSTVRMSAGQRISVIRIGTTASGAGSFMGYVVYAGDN